MGVKDQGLIEYLEDPRRFADLVNGTIFHGSQVAEAKYLEMKARKKRVFLGLKEESGNEVQKKSSGKMQYFERERDMLMLHNKPQKKFYLACEGQSEADYHMPVRNFTYDGVEYSGQLKEEQHLIPVFHLVLYLGSRRWLSKYTLQEMMDIPEELQKYRALLPEYRIQLIDIHEQNPDVFLTEWKDIFRLMGHSRKKEELKKYIEENKTQIRKLSPETRRFLAILLDQYEIMKDGKLEVKEMCEAWDGAMLMYKEEGKEEGKKEGEERVSRLNLMLLKEKRYQDLERASRDKEYRRTLFEAFQI